MDRKVGVRGYPGRGRDGVDLLADRCEYAICGRPDGGERAVRVVGDRIGIESIVDETNRQHWLRLLDCLWYDPAQSCFAGVKKRLKARPIPVDWQVE
jgi:hypothetical protein